MKKTILLAAIAAIVLTTWIRAQTPPGPILSYSATTDNVAGAPDSIRIDVLRWSTDAERDQLLSAWTNPGAQAAGRGARGRAASPPDPVADGNDPVAGATPATDQPTAGGGRGGGGGRGAAGGGRGGGAGGGGRGGGGAARPAAPVEPPTPERSLAAALGQAPTVGHLWSSEVAGYSLRLAMRLPGEAGGERILLITERRLGAFNDLWKPVAPSPAPNYEFSVIELRLNSKGEGEGKISLTGKVAVDGPAKTIALENYSESSVILKNVKRK